MRVDKRATFPFIFVKSFQSILNSYLRVCAIVFPLSAAVHVELPVCAANYERSMQTLAEFNLLLIFSSI
jgi:hypothetical protein